MRSFPLISRLGLLLLALVFLTSGGKRDKFSITFHLQGDENEGKFVMPDPESEGLVFRINQELSHHQMTSFYPFLSEDGTTYGAVFVLNSAGRQRLTALEVTETGKLLRAVVNGRPVDYLEIDHKQNVNEIVIWHGLTERDFELFQHKLRRLQFPSR